MVSSEIRYKGAQSLLKKVGEEGCYVLCLLSIAEEVTGKPIDLISALHILIKDRCVEEDMYVLDAEKALYILTGRRAHREIRKDLGKMKDNEYTVAKYYNKRTGLTHFKRRGYDTLTRSVTATEGELQFYYVFEIEGK
mgnify:CR=1 FL=1